VKIEVGKMLDDLRIVMTRDVYNDICIMIDTSPVEIAAYLSCSMDNQIITVDSIHIPKQNVSGTVCDITQEGGDEVLIECAELGKAVNGWVHSHVNMTCMWSGKDKETMKLLREHSNTAIVSIVGIKSRKFLCHVDIPIQTPWETMFLEIDDVPMQVIDTVNSARVAELESIIKERVTEQKYVWNYQPYKSANRYPSYPTIQELEMNLLKMGKYTKPQLLKMSYMELKNAWDGCNKSVYDMKNTLVASGKSTHAELNKLSDESATNLYHKLFTDDEPTIGEKREFLVDDCGYTKGDARRLSIKEVYDLYEMFGSMNQLVEYPTREEMVDCLAEIGVYSTDELWLMSDETLIQMIQASMINTED